VPFTKGVAKHPNSGRKPGQPNAITLTVKEQIENCYKAIGGDKRFSEWADANPDLFYVHIYPKIIPKDIHVTGTIGVAQLLIEAGNMMKQIEAPSQAALPSLEHVPLVVLDNNAPINASVSPPSSLPAPGTQIAQEPTDPKP
jgi:hypothetical protein